MQPWCIYCGGHTRATTIDHMPPVVIFDGRQRPRGLEFSACAGCNAGSRLAEQVIGLLSRMYPNAAGDFQRQEVKRLMREVENNHPGLLREMVLMPAQRASFEGSGSGACPGTVRSSPGPGIGGKC